MQTLSGDAIGEPSCCLLSPHGAGMLHSREKTGRNSRGAAASDDIIDAGRTWGLMGVVVFGCAPT